MSARNIIIPAGTINPNHINIIEIPEEFRNVPTLIASSRRGGSPSRSLPPASLLNANRPHSNISQPMTPHHVSCPTGQSPRPCPARNVTFPPPAGHPVKYLDRSRAIPESFREFLPIGASSFKEYEGPKFVYGRNESACDSYSGGSGGISSLVSGSGGSSGYSGGPRGQRSITMNSERVQSDPALGMVTTTSATNINRIWTTPGSIREISGHVNGSGQGLSNLAGQGSPNATRHAAPNWSFDRPGAASSPQPGAGRQEYTLGMPLASSTFNQNVTARAGTRPLCPMMDTVQPEDLSSINTFNYYEDAANDQELSPMAYSSSSYPSEGYGPTYNRQPNAGMTAGYSGTTGYPHSGMSSGYASCPMSSIDPSYVSSRSRSEHCMCKKCCAARPKPPPCQCGQ